MAPVPDHGPGRASDRAALTEPWSGAASSTCRIVHLLMVGPSCPRRPTSRSTLRDLATGFGARAGTVPPRPRQASASAQLEAPVVDPAQPHDREVVGVALHDAPRRPLTLRGRRWAPRCT